MKNGEIACVVGRVISVEPLAPALLFTSLGKNAIVLGSARRLSLFLDCWIQRLDSESSGSVSVPGIVVQVAAQGVHLLDEASVVSCCIVRKNSGRRLVQNVPRCRGE